MPPLHHLISTTFSQAVQCSVMALGSSLMMSQLTVEPLIVALPSSCRCCVAICYAAADFFQKISGDPSNTASVFLTSTYGPLADKWQSNIGLYNYALFFIGSQPAGAGTPFLPQDALTTAVDWSPFSPHAATRVAWMWQRDGARRSMDAARRPWPTRPP